MISPKTIEEIKERANLVDIVGESVKLRRVGSSFSGLCPFHSENSASFYIRDAGRYYHCFGCGASGNAISYVMNSRGLSFPDAIEELAARYGIVVQTEGRKVSRSDQTLKNKLFKVNQLAQVFFQNQYNDAPQVLKAYTQERHLTAQAETAYGIGFAPKSWQGLTEFLKLKGVPEEIALASGLVRRNSRGELMDTFRARLMFPIWLDNRRIVGFGGRIIPKLIDSNAEHSPPKYLNSPETAIYQKSKILFGLPQAISGLRGEKNLYLVEGYMDVVGLWQAGVKNVVATCGTAVTDQHVRRLAHLVKRVSVLFDGDTAGRTAAARCFPLFLNSGIDASAIFLPEDEDPDTIAAAHGQATKAFLDASPRVSLLDCFIDGLIQNFGASDTKTLGASAKGQISAQVAEVIGQIKNLVEQAEVIERAAMKLIVSPKTLTELVTNRKPKASSEQNTETEATAEEMGHKSIAELPAWDRQILLAIMGKKESLAQLALQNSDICLGVQPDTRQFLEGLFSIISAEASEDAKRQHCKQLLAEFGDSWKALWVEAHQMVMQPEVNLEKTFWECVQAIKKNEVNQQLIALRQQLGQVEDDTQKLEIAAQAIQLERSLRHLSGQTVS